MDLDEEELKATREKTADELLAELGYIKESDYYYRSKEEAIQHKHIRFFINSKEVIVESTLRFSYEITMQELQAINKKCKELRVVIMNDTLKTEILHSMNDILEENKSDYQNVLDMFNLVKIIENYEELEPDIQNMLNKKARKDKWSER